MTKLKIIKETRKGYLVELPKRLIKDKPKHITIKSVGFIGRDYILCDLIS